MSAAHTARARHRGEKVGRRLGGIHEPTLIGPSGRMAESQAHAAAGALPRCTAGAWADGPGAMSRVQIDADTFLSAAFSTRQPDEKVALGLAYPGNRGFSPQRWEPGTPVRPLGLHFNCATFKPEAAHARLDAVIRVHVVMLDDVGNMEGRSKCPLDRVLALPPNAQPHVIIVTRRDGDCINTQCFWFITPVAHEVARSLVAAAAKAGWGDPGASGGVRWARPPGSIKQDGNGYAATMLHAQLDAPRIDIDNLAQALGLPVAWREEANIRRSGHAAGAAQGRSPNGDAPPADDVRAAMRLIVNDLDRPDWLRVGMALMACCGSPPAISDAEGLALFDEFSRLHPSYNGRDTARAWRGFRPTRSGFGTLVHFARRAVLEIGSGHMNDDPVSPQTPTCVMASDATLARAAMRAAATTHALVVPEFNSLLVRVMNLPLVSSRVVIVHRGTVPQREAAKTLYRRVVSYGIPATMRAPKTPQIHQSGE